MPELLMLKGLPGSGKSTYAKELVGKGWLRVNNDDLRASLNNGKWSKANERIIDSTRDHIISVGLANGFNVVVDNLNLHPKHYKHLLQVAQDMDARFSQKFFDTPVEECIKRDLKRENSVGSKVIKRWYKDYLAEEPVVYLPDNTASPAIVCDIDGTLAHMEGRSPYDESRVLEDACDTDIAAILDDYRPTHKIVIVSGRHETCRQDTEDWLRTHFIAFDALYMRKAGDDRSDVDVKQEILYSELHKYNIKFVLDDRNRVVDMWRNNGLKCLQVAEGDF